MSNEGWREVTSAEAPHLGGNYRHGALDTFCPKVWDHLIERFCVETALDLGSGLGHASHYMARKGVRVLAVDGLADNVEHAVYPTILHDLTKGPVVTRVDLVHCQEVVEHIEERYLDNVLNSLMCGRYIVMTNALPGQSGYHHVNEQPTQYWADHLAARGCHPLIEDSQRLRALAMAEGATYLAETGVVYANDNRG